jgi:hypothetical protein
MWHCSTSEGRNVKCLFRHLFTFCSAVSLMLFMTICVLWVRSHFASDVLYWLDSNFSNRNVPSGITLRSNAGRITYEHVLPSSSNATGK